MIQIKGKLYICPTPLGNLEDITLRVLRILQEADLIAAEDTRHSKKLMNHYNIQTQVISYHQHSSQNQLDRLVGQILEGKTVALISDAGTPGISDPGQALISECIAREIEVDPLPGPCAAVTAISASGFPLASFTFIGFLPRTGLAKAVLALTKIEHPVILYESPRRIGKLLELLSVHMPEREVLLARELSKYYQQLIRGGPELVLEKIRAEELERGEFTVVLGPWKQTAPKQETVDVYSLAEQYISSGMSVKDAAAKVSLETEIPRREVYNLIVRKKKKDT